MELPVLLDARSQGVDVGAVVMVMVDEPILWDGASFEGPVVKRVKDTGTGGARVLWVGWQHQHLGDALGLQCIHHLRDAGLPIAHRIPNAHVFLGVAKALL